MMMVVKTKLKSVRVKSTSETSGEAVVVGQVTEVDKDTFCPIVNVAVIRLSFSICTLNGK